MNNRQLDSNIQPAAPENLVIGNFDWRKQLSRGPGVWEDAFYHRVSNPRRIDTRFLDTHPKVAARPGEYSWVAARVPPGCQVVDVGTGPSHFAHKLADCLGCMVFCVDPDLVELPRHERVVPVRVSFEDWVVAPDSIECVTLVSVLEHIRPVEDGDMRLMQSVHRCLKPGGICLITTPFTGTMRGEVDPRYDGVSSLQRYYSLEDIYLRLIAPSNFVLVETDYLWTSKDVSQYRWTTVPKATVICVALRKRSAVDGKESPRQDHSSSIHHSTIEYLTS